MTWLYTYPTISSVWKKSEQVLHTVALPPYAGSRSRATSGWMVNSSPAPTNAVRVNSTAVAAPARDPSRRGVVPSVRRSSGGAVAGTTVLTL